jgi:hypothetical protein
VVAGRRGQIATGIAPDRDEQARLLKAIENIGGKREGPAAQDDFPT